MRFPVAGKCLFYSVFLGVLCVTSQSFAIFQSTVLNPFYCQAVYLSSAEQTAKQYEHWSQLRDYPGNLAENSSAQLFDSVSAFTRKSQMQVASQKAVSLWKDKVLFLNEKIPQKWRGFWVLQATLEKALRDQGIDFNTSFEVGILAQRALAEAQGQSWNKYRSSVNQALGQEIIPFKRNMQLDQTFKALLSAVHVDKTFQIPYLAGYGEKDAHQIYIDRGVKPYYLTEDGRKIDVALDLTIHEFVEKSLIDLTQLPEKKYLRTHQIAQRIEKAMVEYYGYSWADYQGRIMKDEIERADHDGRSAATLLRVPKDLDLTPYIEYEEWEMIDLMKKVGQPRED